jgi:hypothetical protein
LELELHLDHQETISIECDKCDSFLVDIKIFYDVIEEVLDFGDSEDFIGEFELWETMFNKWDAIKERLCVEWNIIQDFDRSEEIAIIFDKKCTCVDLFVGTPDEEETIKDAIDFQSQDGAVSKHIGPKIRW